MTDQELAQAVFDRLCQYEAAAAGDPKLARRWARVHVHLDRAMKALPGGMVQPLSGGGMKP